MLSIVETKKNQKQIKKNTEKNNFQKCYFTALLICVMF